MIQNDTESFKKIVLYRFKGSQQVKEMKRRNVDDALAKIITKETYVSKFEELNKKTKKTKRAIFQRGSKKITFF